MSSKGIGPLERRAEFVALATALVSASSILVFEIVTSNGAEIDAMWVRPSTVDRTLKEHAEPIDRNLGPHAPSQIVVPEPSSIAPRFQAALDAGVGEPTVASLHYPVRVASGALVIDAVRYVEPVVPAPRDLLVAQYIDTIVPEEVERHEQLAARFDDAPFDIGWVTASARFDLAVARAAFGEGDADREPIPLAWWHENIQFLDVVVEREALVAGTWSDRRTLEPLPGRFSLRLRLGLSLIHI